MTVGVLALMVIVGTSFALNMMVDHKSAVNMAVSAQAMDAAEAGLNLAIISARNLAVSNFNGVPSATMSGSLGNVGRGNTAAYSVTITDTASQFNINETNPSLGTMLENLVAILGSPLQAGDGTAIITARATIPGQVYLTKQQVIDALPGANLTVKTAKFNKIAAYITVSNYIDQNSESTTIPPFTGSTLNNSLDNPASAYQPKAPVNINTADPIVLRAVLASVITPTDPATLANDIKTRREANFFISWTDFNGFIDGLAYLAGDEKIKIENNANPNKVKVDNAGVPISYTTDFCFQPSGVYEITSTGTVGWAQKRITALVRIYDIINYTTKEQFRGNTYTVIPAVYDGTLPIFKNVNWLNSCPVVSTYDHGLSVDPAAYYGANANAIANSLKLGFWDNFDEDNNNVNSVGWSWRNWKDSSTFGHNILITDVNPVYPSSPHGAQPNLTDGDNELGDDAFVGWTAMAYLDLRGSQSGQWNCDQEFSLRVYCNILKRPPDQISGQASTFYDNNDRWEGYEDTEQVDFVPAGQTGQMYISNFRAVYFGSYGSKAIIDGKGYDVPGDLLDSMLRLNFYGGGGDHYMYLNKDSSGNYMYTSIGDASSSFNLTPPDANRIVPINATFRLIVHNPPPPAPPLPPTTPNYQVYLGLSPTGIAYHEWPDSSNASPGDPNGCEADGGAWIPWFWQIHYLTYNAVDTNYHQFIDTGTDDRYGYMGSQLWHNQSVNHFIYNDWYLRLINHPSTTYGHYALFDQVRLIPDQGYYISPAFTTAGNARFGTASWTLTIPPGAVTNERVAVEISMDGGTNYSAVGINSGVSIVPSANLRFKVTLLSDDPQHLQTPVLEDITVTRLPKATVLYRRYE